jgi:hypothetical protein
MSSEEENDCQDGERVCSICMECSANLYSIVHDNGWNSHPNDTDLCIDCIVRLHNDGNQVCPTCRSPIGNWIVSTIDNIYADPQQQLNDRGYSPPMSNLYHALNNIHINSPREHMYRRNSGSPMRRNVSPDPPLVRDIPSPPRGHMYRRNSGSPMRRNVSPDRDRSRSPPHQGHVGDFRPMLERREFPEYDIIRAQGQTRLERLNDILEEREYALFNMENSYNPREIQMYQNILDFLTNEEDLLRNTID